MIFNTLRRHFNRITHIVPDHILNDLRKTFPEILGLSSIVKSKAKILDLILFFKENNRKNTVVSTNGRVERTLRDLDNAKPREVFVA